MDIFFSEHSPLQLNFFNTAWIEKQTQKTAIDKSATLDKIELFEFLYHLTKWLKKLNPKELEEKWREAKEVAASFSSNKAGRELECHFLKNFIYYVLDVKYEQYQSDDIGVVFQKITALIKQVVEQQPSVFEYNCFLINLSRDAAKVLPSSLGKKTVPQMGGVTSAFTAFKRNP